MLLVALIFCLVTAEVNWNIAQFLPKNDFRLPTWKLVPRTQPHPKIKSDTTPDDYFRFIPSFVGRVLPGVPFTWSTDCFSSNNATLVISGNKSATLTINSNIKSSLFCDDLYLIGYVAGFDVKLIAVSYFNHYVEFPGGWSQAELFDINTKGIRIFKFPDGLVASAHQVFETVMLFFGGLIGAHVPEWTAEDNLKFLRDHMNVEMPPRAIPRVDISPREVKSGDFLGIMRLDGLDPMLAWAMGSRTGHTALTLWMDGRLYVVESTIASAYWPKDGIQRTLWEDWLQLAHNASYNVIHVPLSPDVSKRFNEKAAIEFFKSVEGLPYGFHNQFTGWIDTPQDNFPGALSFELAELLMPFGDWLLRRELGKGKTFDFLAQGLNHRLGTKGLTIVEAYHYAGLHNLSMVDVILMPEMDSWIFENDEGTASGPSMVCDVLVTRIWKAAGIFGDVTDQFQAAEFTNWDAYTLNIFDAQYKRPEQCVKADPESKFCQLVGKYRMDLPDYNTFKAFPHMRERCPTKPPKYVKPPNC